MIYLNKNGNVCKIHFTSLVHVSYHIFLKTKGIVLIKKNPIINIFNVKSLLHYEGIYNDHKSKPLLHQIIGLNKPNICSNRTLTNSQKLETYILTAVLSSAVCKLGEFSSEIDMHSES